MRSSKVCLILALVSVLVGCDHFVTVYYVPADFTPEVPTDATKLVTELKAFGAKHEMVCHDYPTQPQAYAVAVCSGGTPRDIDGRYRVITYAGHPQLEYFNVGSGMPLSRDSDCHLAQAVQKALEEFTGPLKTDGGSDPCIGEDGNAKHG